jgi:hypothetical protein
MPAIAPTERALLAGVYPVGMKIAVGWETTGRGFRVGSLAMLPLRRRR